MPNRRDFLRNAAGATAGALLLNRGLSLAHAFPQAGQAGGRRQIVIGGRRMLSGQHRQFEYAQQVHGDRRR